MAGHARYTALLDACVLYPVAMTDALLSLATAGFFAAKWTTLIETEWTLPTTITMNRSRFAGFVVHTMLNGTGRSLKGGRWRACTVGI